MRTGEAQRAARGFTYLWLLFLLVIGAALLAGIGERTSLRLQRDRELELLFRGREIAAAIGAYRSAVGAGPARWPRSLDELVEDRRGLVTVRHLRRVYADPMTGESDWVPILADDPNDSEGWRGVHSRSDAPAVLSVRDAGAQGPPGPRRTPRVSDHLFVAPIPPAPVASSASATEALPAEGENKSEK